MKRTLAAIVAMTALCWAGNGHTAPAPYPVTINSRAQTAPPLPAFRANEHTFRVTFTDSGTPSDVSGYIPFLNWSTNRAAAGVSTSAWSFVASGTNGVVDFTFSPAALNHDEGRYVYEVGVKTSDGVVRAYAQGALMLYGSPTGSGADVVSWLAMADWNLIQWSNLPDYQTGAQVDAKIAAAGGGVTDHAALSNLTWAASGHSGTPARLAGFFEGGAAGYSALGAGLYFDGSDSLSVSNDIITGAAAGATALQAEAQTLADVTALGATTENAITVDAGDGINIGQLLYTGVSVFSFGDELQGFSADYQSKGITLYDFNKGGEPTKWLFPVFGTLTTNYTVASTADLLGLTNGLLSATGSGAGLTGIPQAGVTGLTDALAGKAATEGIVTGAVVTVTSGNRYYWTTSTNVSLTASLSAGEVVNLAILRNTATNSITATGQAGWVWTGGSTTNTIAAGKRMTFGFTVDPSDGTTNAYATAVSQ